MFAGTARVDITPAHAIYMDGMIRDQKSDGIHDPLFARALVVSNSPKASDAVVLIALDLCAITNDFALATRALIANSLGMDIGHVILAASHTHSGPATFGFFCDREEEYNALLSQWILQSAIRAAQTMIAVLTGYKLGSESSISHYRRFIDKTGKVIMFWEENQDQYDMQVLGECDPHLGILQFRTSDSEDSVLATLINHAGHPNVMSGDNYTLSADYPGVACATMDTELGGISIFTNGAQGSVDIDNWKFRDWDGMAHIGGRLADAAIATAEDIVPSEKGSLTVEHADYLVPSRKISSEELSWAEAILQVTGGKVQPIADGVGDDFKAVLFRNLHAVEDTPVPVSQTCFAIGETAFVTVPGELFTEIGQKIRKLSPFKYTHIIGLANGYIGYIPTLEAIAQGGYEVETRDVDDVAGEMIEKKSLELLNKIYAGGNQIQ